MFASKPSETGVDVVTCKMSKNTDKKLDVSSLLGTLLFVETFICHPRSLPLPALAPPTSYTSFYFLLNPSPLFQKIYIPVPPHVCLSKARVDAGVLTTTSYKYENNENL